MTQIEKQLCFSLPNLVDCSGSQHSPIHSCTGAFQEVGSDMGIKSGVSSGLLQQLTCQAKKCFWNFAWAFCEALSNPEIRRTLQSLFSGS